MGNDDSASARLSNAAFAELLAQNRAAEADILKTAWQIVGIFARCEAEVDGLIDWHLQDVHSGILAVIKKRHLSDEERRKALKAVLQYSGVAELYPDLPSLYGQVAVTRNRLTHNDLAYSPPNSIDFAGRPVPTGLALLASDNSRQAEVWTTDHVDGSLNDAIELEQLIRMLCIEVGSTSIAVNVETGTPGRWRAVPVGWEIALGPRDPHRPRKPMEMGQLISEARHRYNVQSREA